MLIELCFVIIHSYCIQCSLGLAFFHFKYLPVMTILVFSPYALIFPVSDFIIDLYTVGDCLTTVITFSVVLSHSDLM